MMDMMISVARDVDDIVYNTKRDPGGIGFIDDVGGNVDGLMSCTESLGFESSDERRVDDRIESLNRFDEESYSRKGSVVCSRLMREKDLKKEIKKFPPPLSSLSQDGRPTFFLRPVRGDGRLMLTEVKIARTEILRASRQDGRLKLHIVRGEEDEDDDIQEQQIEEEQYDEDEEENQMQDNQEEEIQKYLTAEETEEEEEVEEKEDELETVEVEVEGWQFSTNGGSDVFRRCHEQVSHHHANHPHHHGHHQHVWRQHCLTIR